MPPSPYPTNTAILRTYEAEQPQEAAVTASPKFGDGGQDFNLDATTTTRTWEIEYMNQTSANYATAVAHAHAAAYNDREGSAYAFDFTPRGGSSIPNVRYAPGGFKRLRHNKDWIISWTVKLIKYP